MGPQRIVCLTEEPTEVLYALGEQHRIVGISGFTVRPAIARKEKPKVSAFTSAKIGEILKLPDVKAAFAAVGVDPSSASPEDTARFVIGDQARWRNLAVKSNLPLN